MQNGGGSVHAGAWCSVAANTATTPTFLEPSSRLAFNREHKSGGEEEQQQCTMSSRAANGVH
jgi:hypothetical protein